MWSIDVGSRSWFVLAVVLVACNSPVKVWASATFTEVDLGRRLFEDKNLSADRSVACSSCHADSRAFSDGRRVSLGVGGHSGTRNAPSLLGVGANSPLFWDGRADTLEEQATFPLFSAMEMGLSGEAELLSRVSAASTIARAESGRPAIRLPTRASRSCDRAR